jgi:hypothetical protein
VPGFLFFITKVFDQFLRAVRLPTFMIADLAQQADTSQTNQR